MAHQTETIHHQGKFLLFRQRGRWEYVSRTNASDVVAIAAMTTAQEVILVEQVRLPLGEAGRAVIELPAGLVGDDGIPDEDLRQAAHRELVEETGFHAQQLTPVGLGPSSAGLTDELVTLLVARDVVRVGPGGGVDGEDIITHLIPSDEVHDWLTRRAAAGDLIDHKVWAGLYWLQYDQNPIR